MARDTRSVPLTAAVLAAGYLIAAVALPPLLPAVAAAAAVGTCALALARRTQPGLGRAMVAIGCWLACGFAGVWWLRGEPIGGFAFLLVGLFVAPLPVVPWLYERTFSDGTRGGRGGTP